LGWLSLDQALGLLSERLGLRLGYVLLPFPDAAVDVDTPADWEYVRKRFESAGAAE
jgi:CTP:molybdopterin cytidylyltransferase MocA